MGHWTSTGIEPKDYDDDDYLQNSNRPRPRRLNQFNACKVELGFNIGLLRKKRLDGDSKSTNSTKILRFMRIYKRSVI